MKCFLFALTLLLIAPAFAEESTTTARYALRYNFSKLLIPKSKFLGVIGADGQRLDMTLSSASKGSDSLFYDIKGSSKVKDRVCALTGTIHVDEIKEYTQMHYGVDDEYKSKGVRAEGELLGTYELKEDPRKKGCGIFSGQMTVFWYVDSTEKIVYDDIEIKKDGFKNNQYVGSWRAYNSDEKKIAKWGEYLVPQ